MSEFKIINITVFISKKILKYKPITFKMLTKRFKLNRRYVYVLGFYTCVVSIQGKLPLMKCKC